jgi:hypothetical protein
MTNASNRYFQVDKLLFQLVQRLNKLHNWRSIGVLFDNQSSVSCNTSKKWFTTLVQGPEGFGEPKCSQRKEAVLAHSFELQPKIHFYE